MGESGLKGGLIEVGEEFHGSVEDCVEELVGDSGLSGVDPELDNILASVARVVDGVAGVISLEDVEVRHGDGGSEEGDVASAISSTVSLGVDTKSWGPQTEDLRLEGVVDLEVFLTILIGGGVEVGVASGGALVLGGLLGVIDVLLLNPGASELLEVEVGKGHDGIAGDVGCDRGKHLVLLNCGYRSIF